jgi:hypothetical protein
MRSQLTKSVVRNENCSGYKWLYSRHFLWWLAVEPIIKLFTIFGEFVETKGITETFCEDPDDNGSNGVRSQLLTESNSICQELRPDPLVRTNGTNV